MKHAVAVDKYSWQQLENQLFFLQLKLSEIQRFG